MRFVHPFVAEIFCHLINAVETADDKALQIKFVSNSEVECTVESLMMGRERAGESTPINGLKYGCFHLEEFVLIEKSSKRRGNLRSLTEDIPNFRIHYQIEMALAVALLLIGKGVECRPIFLFTAGKRTDAFRQHSQFRHIDGNLASLGGKDVSLCSHNVAYIEELEHLVVFLANVIPFDVALNFSHIILDVEKRRFPHPAERDQASGC